MEVCGKHHKKLGFFYISCVIWCLLLPLVLRYLRLFMFWCENTASAYLSAKGFVMWWWCRSVPMV